MVCSLLGTTDIFLWLLNTCAFINAPDDVYANECKDTPHDKGNEGYKPELIETFNAMYCTVFTVQNFDFSTYGVGSDGSSFQTCKFVLFSFVVDVWDDWGINPFSIIVRLFEVNHFPFRG